MSRKAGLLPVRSAVWPAEKMLAALSAYVPCHGRERCPMNPRDRAALVEFYNATDGRNWRCNTNWNSGVPLDHWFGVFTDNGCVTQLVLQDNQLSGAIPESLGNLAGLTELCLGDNRLSGAIPALSSLTQLKRLSLHTNRS